MSKKILKIKDRVLYLAENKEVSKQVFFKKTNLKYSNFTGKSKESDLNSKSVGEILLIYPDVNPIWLLIGEGPMLMSEVIESPHVSSETNIDYKAISKVQEELIEYKNKEIETLKKRVEDLEKFLSKPEDNKRKRRVST